MVNPEDIEKARMEAREEEMSLRKKIAEQVGMVVKLQSKF